MPLTVSIAVDPVSGKLVKEIKKDEYNILRVGLTPEEEKEHYARLDNARKARVVSTVTVAGEGKDSLPALTPETDPELTKAAARKTEKVNKAKKSRALVVDPS